MSGYGIWICFCVYKQTQLGFLLSANLKHWANKYIIKKSFLNSYQLFFKRKSEKIKIELYI